MVQTIRVLGSYIPGDMPTRADPAARAEARSMVAYGVPWLFG